MSGHPLLDFADRIDRDLITRETTLLNLDPFDMSAFNAARAALVLARDLARTAAMEDLKRLGSPVEIAAGERLTEAHRKAADRHLRGVTVGVQDLGFALRFMLPAPRDGLPHAEQRYRDGFDEALGEVIKAQTVNEAVEGVRRLMRAHGAKAAHDRLHGPTVGTTETATTEANARALYGTGSESDPLYDQAVAMVLEKRRPSISMVQMHLKIGYNRAARLLEEMELRGILTPMGADGVRGFVNPQSRGRTET